MEEHPDPPIRQSQLVPILHTLGHRPRNTWFGFVAFLLSLLISAVVAFATAQFAQRKDWRARALYEFSSSTVALEGYGYGQLNNRIGACDVLRTWLPEDIRPTLRAYGRALSDAREWIKHQASPLPPQTVRQINDRRASLLKRVSEHINSLITID